MTVRPGMCLRLIAPGVRRSRRRVVIVAKVCPPHFIDTLGIAWWIAAFEAA